MKLCKQCGQTKSLDDFGLDADARDGHNYLCRVCARAYSRSVYQRNRAHLFDTGPLTLDCAHCGTELTYIKTTGKRRIYCSDACKHAVAEANRRKRAAEKRCGCGSADVGKSGPQPVCLRCRKDKRDRQAYNRSRRMAMYGLSEDAFTSLLDSQGGVCAICRNSDAGPRGWHIDHDHACCAGVGSCGRCVRGLLCHRCNLMLGNAQDDINRLAAAQVYLLKNANVVVTAGVGG